MQAFVVVLLVGCVCLGAANPYSRPPFHFFQSESFDFYKPTETLTDAKPHVAAFASIFQNDEIVPLKEIPVEQVAKPLAIAIQPVLSNFHDETHIFEVEDSDEPNSDVPRELPVEAEDNVIVVVEEDDEEDNEYIPSPSDIPGFSYADTPEKLAALGIDTRFVDPGILEDSFLLVVSGGEETIIAGT